ncbi:MAG: hypothetical protein ABSG53_11280 [Thermoguttaceae bacterium]|jgi:hypothetical protein
MFKSFKSLVVVAGLVGAVLVSNVHARGFGGGGGSSHISAANSSATRGNRNFKQSTNFQKSVQLSSVKPANTLGKLDNVSKTDKLVKLDKGNQFSAGKDSFLASKSLNFKKSMYSKYCKSFWGYCPWGWCWDWGCYGSGWGCYGGYYGCGYCGYDVCGCDYYVPQYIASAYASPAIATAPVTETAPVTVINPATSEAALSFAVGGQTYTLQAGESKDIDTASGNEIQFDRGNGDTARYTLSDGAYTFGAAQSGWELYRGNLTSTATGITAGTTMPAADHVATNE